MSGRMVRYDEEFKKNAVKLSYANSKSVAQTAQDLGISEQVLYLWRRRYTAEGNKTRYAKQADELKLLRLENTQLKTECDMLKKTTACFANPRE